MQLLALAGGAWDWAIGYVLLSLVAVGIWRNGRRLEAAAVAVGGMGTMTLLAVYL